MNRTTLVLPALISLLAPVLVGCGALGGSGGDGEAIVVGTTDPILVTKDNPAPLDPAVAYDINSWNVLQNTFQTLMRQPRTGTEPEPDAAQRCGFTDRRSEQYRCTVRKNLKFSNGHELTADDVKFSIERMLKIKNPNGPFGLLTNIDKVETPDDLTVVFHLKTPDATFPLKLATPAAAIVDSEVYDKAKLYRGTELVGSGPYTIDVESKGNAATKAVFSENENYEGTLKPRNGKVELRIFKNSKDMEEALNDGTIDLMNRSMDPTQVKRLKEETPEGVDFYETPGAEIRYLAFNVADPSVKNPAVRQAMAQIVDRTKIVRDVYERTVEPLFAMIPKGILGHNTAFYDEYEEPDAGKAETILRDAGVSTPVKLTLHYTTDHYGPATKKEFEELRDQLNGSKLFDVNIVGKAWDKYYSEAVDGEYAAYGMGWYPDFPDPDTYTAPFIGKENFLKNNYKNPAVEALIPQTRQEAQRERSTKTFEKIQDAIATDVPLLPLWQGKQYIAARDSITGAEWALNSSSTLQLWELQRGLEE